MTEICSHNTLDLDLHLKELIPSSLCSPVFKSAKDNNRRLLRRYNKTRKYKCVRVCANARLCVRIYTTLF